MKFGDIEAKAGLFEDVATKAALLGERAAAYPKDAEAYRELPVEQRMRVAESLLKRYTPESHGGEIGVSQDAVPKNHRTKSVVIVEPEDYPGMQLKALVVPEVQTVHASMHGAFIWVQAVDPEKDLESSYSYPLAGVVHSFRGFEAITEPTGSSWEGPRVPLDDEQAKDAIGIIDQAAIGLIEGVVAAHRQFVGGQAVARTAEM